MRGLRLLLVPVLALVDAGRGASSSTEPPGNLAVTADKPQAIALGAFQSHANDVEFVGKRA